MNFKETFLKLTEYTIPFGEEEMIIPFLKSRVPGLERDEIGNYFVKIGDSETLFTTHLDTYSEEVEKVNHTFEDDFIGTDGTTILGGDNKNGMTILLYMIEQNIPGTYYFFIGEEPILSGGLYGSGNILRRNPEFFKKFKRAIAFDRKQMGSVVTRQMARKCCSDEFAEYLISEFAKNKLKFQKDPAAYYTDTASFLNVIPEITNLSAGGWGEHTKKEKSLITYIEAVAKAATKINWEDAPIIRKSGEVTTLDKIKKFAYTKGNIPYNKLIKITKNTFEKVDNLLSMFSYKCLNIKEFDVDVKMLFSHWHKDSEIILRFIGENIYMNDEKIGNFMDLKDAFGIKFENFVDVNELLSELYDSEKTIYSIKQMNKILDEYNCDVDDLLKYMNGENSKEFNTLITFDNNKFILTQ